MTSKQQALKFYTILNRTTAAVNKVMEKDIRSYGLNPTEFGVLELLYHKGDQPIQKIGEKILIASSSITYVLDKLEKKDLIKRVPCPSDRRVTYATITVAGKELIERIFPTHENAIASLVKDFSQLELEIVTEKLKKIGLLASFDTSK